MDFTSTNIEAALLDQLVAGEFRGKTYAFVALAEGGGYILGVAVANEQGYNPVGGKVFDDFNTAKVWAKGLNDHIGLSVENAAGIVISTMGGKPYVRR